MSKRSADGEKEIRQKEIMLEVGQSTIGDRSKSQF
jgi:hypothetical protein